MFRESPFSADDFAVDRSDRGTNQRGMRARNERLILSLLWRRGAMAKAEIARRTDLSAQTVSVIMRRLEEEGLLRRGEPVRGKVGQPSVPMEIVRDGALFLGLKAGRRSADLILTDFSGGIRDRQSLIYAYPEPVAVLDFATKAIARVTGDLSAERRKRIAGLGVAIPYMLWNWAGTLGVPQAAMDPWRHVNLEAELGRQTGLPVFVENDATAACGAELVFGSNRGIRHFVYFYVGFFIGGGIVLNRALFTGPTGNAGAMGALRVSDHGRPAPLMDVASLSVLERALAAEGYDTSCMWEDPTHWSLDAAILARWVEGTGVALAQAIASCASVIDFEYALIDGWLPPTVRADVVATTKRHIATLNTMGIDLPKVREGSVGHDARAIGAAAVPLSERFLTASDL